MKCLLLFLTLALSQSADDIMEAFRVMGSNFRQNVENLSGEYISTYVAGVTTPLPENRYCDECDFPVEKMVTNSCPHIGFRSGSWNFGATYNVLLAYWGYNASRWDVFNVTEPHIRRITRELPRCSRRDRTIYELDSDPTPNAWPATCRLATIGSVCAMVSAVNIGIYLLAPLCVAVIGSIIGNLIYFCCCYKK